MCIQVFHLYGLRIFHLIVLGSIYFLNITYTPNEILHNNTNKNKMKTESDEEVCDWEINVVVLLRRNYSMVDGKPSIK